MPSHESNNWSNKQASDFSSIPTVVLHERVAFAALLRVERMRSDRSGMPFALAVFSFESNEAEKQCNRFAKQLQSRIRATDHIGRMTSKRIAVILWDTTLDGARNFVRKLSDIRESDQPQSVEILVYPDLRQSGTSEEGSDVSHSSAEKTDGNDHLQTPVSGSTSATQMVVDTETRTFSAVQKHLELSEALVQELMEETEPAALNAGQSVGSVEALFVQRIPLWKRSIDITGAAFGLIVLSPLLITVAAIIKVTSPGPVVFKQQRSGRGGKPFTMYKFRSMVVDAEEKKQELLQENEQDGPAFKIENDPRITRIGHFIRKTSIDELPQLWNVLRGDMSLVGPRPLPCQETDACQNWQRRRLEVTPGLTCIWQVQDRRTKIPFADWARMDIRYIGSRTLKHDVHLVLKTFQSILGRKGS